MFIRLTMVDVSRHVDDTDDGRELLYVDSSVEVAVISIRQQ